MEVTNLHLTCFEHILPRFAVSYLFYEQNGHEDGLNRELYKRIIKDAKSLFPLRFILTVKNFDWLFNIAFVQQLAFKKAQYIKMLWNIWKLTQRY